MHRVGWRFGPSGPCSGAPELAAVVAPRNGALGVVLVARAELGVLLSPACTAPALSGSGFGRDRRDPAAAPPFARTVSAGRNQPLIPRYSLPPMADLFTDEARFATWLEVEVLAVEAQAKRGRRPAGGGRGHPRSGRIRRRRDRGPGAGHRARRRCVRRRRAGPRRPPRRRVGAPRAHVERCRRHRRSSVTLVRARRPRDRRSRRARGGDRGPGPRVPRHPMVGRTHGIHAEPTTFGAKLALWALQVRRDRVRLRRGARRDRSRQALGRGRHVLQRRPRGRGVCVRAARPASRCRPRRSSAATATPSCSTRARRSASTDRIVRDGVRHLQRTEVREAEEPFRRRRAEGLERDAAQAQPGEVASSSAVWRACCAANSSPGSRTSRCGTSATSRTRPSSGCRSPTRFDAGVLHRR